MHRHSFGSRKNCWKTLRNNPKFFETFPEQRDMWLPSNKIQSELEVFVSLLFGSRRIKNINDLRHLHNKKIENKEKVLPPCSDSLQLYIFRSAYIARRWSLSKENIINVPNRKYHGWNEDGQIHLVKRHFRVTSKCYLLKRQR